MCRRSLSLIWPCTKKLAQALKHKLYPEGGGGGRGDIRINLWSKVQMPKALLGGGEGEEMLELGIAGCIMSDI